jgi:hypothetical protein
MAEAMVTLISNRLIEGAKRLAPTGLFTDSEKGEAKSNGE